ncbi:MAG: outer membrane beta-barrel protein [Ferruginibacter sp.]
MKRFFLAGVLCIAAVSVFGQTKIAVKGGYTYSTAHVSQYEITKPSGYVSGYGIGILFKTPFDGYLHFSPYAMYNRRGFTYHSQTSVDTLFHNTIHYLDLVPSLSIDFPVGKESAFVIAGGFNLSVAFAGTEKSTVNGETSSKKMRFDISSDYGIFDLGLNTSIGFHWQKFLVEAGYNLGLADISNQYDKDGRNIRNRMLNFSLGYYFK